MPTPEPWYDMAEETLRRERGDYSRSRHAHADDVSCAEAGDIGHPRWARAEEPADA